MVPMATKKPAARAKKRPKKMELASLEPKRRPITVVSEPSSSKYEFTPLQITAVQLFIRGYLLPEIAQKLQFQLVPHEPRPIVRGKKARIRLRRWFRSEKFRDLIWQETMIGLDLDSPKIVAGISRKAQAGRIDAARLALELNGRHAPHTEVQPAQVNIVFGSVPRPLKELPEAEVIDADAVVEPDED